MTKFRIFQGEVLFLPNSKLSKLKFSTPLIQLGNVFLRSDSSFHVSYSLRSTPASEIKWLPKINSFPRLRLAGRILCFYVQTKETRYSRKNCTGEQYIHNNVKWKLAMMTTDERGNFCGNSRLVRKLTHTIYGVYLQIAALEQRVHATGHRIKSSHRECPYSSIFTNMWAFCAFKGEQLTRLVELQRSQQIDENLCFGSAVTEAKFLTGRTKKFRFVLKEDCRR